MPEAALAYRRPSNVYCRVCTRSDRTGDYIVRIAIDSGLNGRHMLQCLDCHNKWKSRNRQAGQVTTSILEALNG